MPGTTKRWLAMLLAVNAAPGVGSAARPVPAAAQELAVTPEIEGNWEGPIKTGAIELRVVFRIERRPDGSYAAKLDSPDQGARDIAVEDVRFSDGALRLEAKSIGGVFEGKLDKESAELAGRWKQAGATFPLVLKRVAKIIEPARPQLPKPPFPYDAEEVRYENRDADVRIAGTLTRPRGKGPFPAVLLITGSGPQDRDETLLGHKPFLVIADYLARRGIAVLRVDDRGVGGSSGSVSSSNTEDFAGDVLAGVHFLKGRKEIDAKRLGLVGHSEGGLVAPLCAARSKDVAFIVLLAGPGLPGEEILYLQSALIARVGGTTDAAIAQQRAFQERLFAVVKGQRNNEAAEKQLRELARQASGAGSGQSEAAGPIPFSTLLSPWFRYFLTYDPRPALRKVRCPVLALVGERDLQVPPKENLAEVEKALSAGGNRDVTTLAIPRLNHLFQTSDTGSPGEYGKIEETFSAVALELIGDWIAKRTSR